MIGPSPLRPDVRPADAGAVRRLVSATEFFTSDEVGVAVELVADTLSGRDLDYRFLMADDPERPGELLGYSCFGPIPATVHSWDLYWIAVRPDRQGRGLGRRLLAASEDAAYGQGARRLYLDTSGRQGYAPTRGFYEAAGYAVAAHLPDFYGPDDAKVVYLKLLTGRAEWIP